VHQLEACDGALSRLIGFEAKHGAAHPFHGTMILLQDLIEDSGNDSGQKLADLCMCMIPGLPWLAAGEDKRPRLSIVSMY
jgi:hypothetical protein